MSENQRSFFRIDAAVAVVVRRLDSDGSEWDEFEGETVDLSAGGVLLTSEDFVPQGHNVEVALHSESPPLELSGRGTVVRSWRRSTGSWLSGVCFERLNAHAERELLKFCFLKEREMAERVSNVRIEIAIPARLQRGSDGTIHRTSTVNICADGGRVTAPVGRRSRRGGDRVVLGGVVRPRAHAAGAGRPPRRARLRPRVLRPDARRPRCDQPADHG